MASAVEVVVSAAKVSPAANPVITDLRATRRPYRDICGIPCGGLCVERRISEKALAAGEHLFNLRLGWRGADR
jgi:hypothetical protein